MVRSVTLASLALLALAPLARSQEYREVLTAQFQAVEENMATKGWTHDRAAFPGDVAVHFLEAGAQVGLEIDLQAGADYMILGACDRNCTDLDLTLMDVAAVWSPAAGRFTGADLYGGFRYIGTDFGVRAQLTPPPDPPLSAGVDTSYTDFLLGGRYVAEVNDRWRLVFSGDLSAGDTEGTWSLAGYGVYRNGPHRFYAGYRHLDVEMDGSNGVRVQTTFTGPVVGYGFAF